MFKKLLLCLLFFIFQFSIFNYAGAQHNRMTLLQPTCASHNLRDNPRQVVVTQRYSSGNDNNFQETYLFDDNGNLTEYRKRGFGGEKVTSYPLTLSDLERPRPRGQNNDTIREKIYFFDYDGDVLELRQFDLKGRLISTMHYIYARGGNLAQSVEYTYDADSGNVVKRTVSDYDKREQLKTVRQYTADELLLWKEYRKYDCRGNLTRRVQTFYSDNDKETTVEKRTYSYDSHGNWTTCRYSLNGREIYTIDRTITY